MSPSPDDLAPFICYLATDDASQISGSVFFVGGPSIHLYSEAEWQSSLIKYGDGGRWTVEELKQQVPMNLIGMHKSSTMRMYEMAKK
jgi:hypothetical protein